MEDMFDEVEALENGENGQDTVVPREKPEPGEARAALVRQWQDRVTGAKSFYEKNFKSMRDDQQFVRGKQWKGADGQYVANVAHRHVQQKTAFLYAKNPRVSAKMRPRLLGTVWDGSNRQLMMAQQASAAAMQGMAPPSAEAAQIIAEAEEARSHNQMLRRVGDTLAYLYEYNLDEQIDPFKSMMKLTVRRAITTGVGYVKLGFQRVMEMRPDVKNQIADFTQRLHTLERLAADMADGEINKDDAEAEQLRLSIQALEKEEQVLVREGLALDYPDSTCIIPDTKCKNLRTFSGCEWVAQEYLLSPETIQEVYGVDIATNYRGYARKEAGDDDLAAEAISHMGDTREDAKGENGSRPEAMVWEVYSRMDGLVYVVCDGYPEFLQEPEAPDVYTERFWPWFPLVLNEVDDPSDIFPPSDVSLIRDMQQEYNRSRQGLREHRKANRPKTAVAAGVLDEEDVSKLQDHPANAVLELNALAPGQSVDQVLQPIKNPPIDPALYEVNSVYEDILRVVGVQEATLGSVSGATATETSIAQSSQASATQSNVDDLDEMMTLLARTAGQILFAETASETVKTIVGEGAVWPDMTRGDIAAEIYLEIEAGSTGRPNQAQEIQNAERIFPLLMQIPGVSPEWMAKELLRRLDDRLDINDAFDADMQSIVSQNQNKQPVQGDPSNDPNAQGVEGGANTPIPEESVPPELGAIAGALGLN